MNRSTDKKKIMNKMRRFWFVRRKGTRKLKIKKPKIKRKSRKRMCCVNLLYVRVKYSFRSAFYLLMVTVCWLLVLSSPIMYKFVVLYILWSR